MTNFVFNQIDQYNQISADDISRIPTGIKALDELIDGGIALGELTVLSSSEGSGKSTLTSQIVGYAADHGVKSMIYSGEMSGNSVITTILKQLAGWRWTSTGQVVGGDLVQFETDSYVPDDVAAYLKQHVLHDKVCFYGSDLIRRWDALKQTMEGAYDAGVRLFVIDNLMTLTALFGSDTANTSAYGTDQYHQQNGAVEYLNDFAIAKHCAVVLVAHTKKGGAAVTDEGNDGIYGTSAVKNLAGLIFRFLAPSAQEREQYRKSLAAAEGDEFAKANSPKAPTDRILMVTKNRIQGKTATVIAKYYPGTCRYYDASMICSKKVEDITEADYERRQTEYGHDYGMLWERDYIDKLASKHGVDATGSKSYKIVAGAVKYYADKEAARKQRLEARKHPDDLNRRLSGDELFLELLKKRCIRAQNQKHNQT